MSTPVTLESIFEISMDNDMIDMGLPTMPRLENISVSISENSTISLAVEGKEKGYKRCYSRQEHGENFLKDFADTFKQIMSLEPVYTSKFEYLSLERTNQINPAVFNHVVTGLEESRGVLQSKQLILLLVVFQEEEIIRLFNLMDTEIIDSLIIGRIGGPPGIIRSLCQQPNWPRIRFFVARQSFFCGDSSDLLNLTLTLIDVEEVTMDWIKGFLKRLLAAESTVSRGFKIWYFRFPDRDNLSHEFGPPVNKDTQQQWAFKSGSQKSELFVKLSHDLTTKLVDFAVSTYLFEEESFNVIALDDR